MGKLKESVRWEFPDYFLENFWETFNSDCRDFPRIESKSPGTSSLKYLNNSRS